MNKKKKDTGELNKPLTPSIDNVQGGSANQLEASESAGDDTTNSDEVDEMRANVTVDEAYEASVDNSSTKNDAQGADDEGKVTEQEENDFDEVHSLHSLYFEPSESRTTNIPPRLPLGYSYTSFKTEDAKSDSSKAKAKAQAPSSHPDLPSQHVVTQNEGVKHNRSKRYRHPRKNKMWLATKRWTKRYWWAWLIAAIVVVIVATYNVWMPMVSHWQMEQKDATPVVAADTLPEPVKTEVDTMANVLSHEDSLRIQDSIRHARWLYWKKYKRAKEASQNAEETAEETRAANNGTNTSSATTNEHVPVHANDSTHH